MEDSALPNMGDVNGNPTPVGHVVQLRARVGNTLYHMGLFFVEKRACLLLIGTQLMNGNIEAIWCLQQRVQFTRTRIPIIAHGTRESPWRESPAAAGQPLEPPLVPASPNAAHRVLLCHLFILPAYTQVKGAVVTKLQSLLLL